jgi:hypothetical protein
MQLWKLYRIAKFIPLPNHVMESCRHQVLMTDDARQPLHICPLSEVKTRKVNPIMLGPPKKQMCGVTQNTIAETYNSKVKQIH